VAKYDDEYLKKHTGSLIDARSIRCGASRARAHVVIALLKQSANSWRFFIQRACSLRTMSTTFWVQRSTRFRKSIERRPANSGYAPIDRRSYATLIPKGSRIRCPKNCSDR
jgi:hypothetical protein